MIQVKTKQPGGNLCEVLPVMQGMQRVQHRSKLGWLVTVSERLHACDFVYKPPNKSAKATA